MKNTTVLISDAEVESRTVLTDVLKNRLDYEVVPVAGAGALIDSLYECHDTMPEVVLMDVASEPVLAMKALQEIQQRFPCLPVVALTNYGDMKQASEALDAGAMDYLARPVSHQRLRVTIGNAVRQHRLSEEVSRMQREQAMVGNVGNLLPDSLRLKRLLTHDSASNSPLLLCGEQGVGKEMLARTIHVESKRADHQFVPINCATLTESEMSAISMGLNAHSTSVLINKFSGAKGGTLFLNHIDTLSPKLQYRLQEYLNLVQEIPLANDNNMQENATRLIVSTAHDPNTLEMSNMLTPGFSRLLSGDIIVVPPLRDSRDDIEVLAHHYTERYALQENPVVKGISQQAINLLRRYDWPGNMRELERVIFRAVMLSEDTILDMEHVLPYLPPSCLPDYSHNSVQEAMVRSRRMPLTNESGEVRRLRDMEADTIHFALKFYEGRISEVARKLGIGRSTLYRKLHDLDIEVA